MIQDLRELFATGIGYTQNEICDTFPQLYSKTAKNFKVLNELLPNNPKFVNHPIR
jgi:hypothetical protein